MIPEVAESRLLQPVGEPNQLRSAFAQAQSAHDNIVAAANQHIISTFGNAASVHDQIISQAQSAISAPLAQAGLAHDAIIDQAHDTLHGKLGVAATLAEDVGVPFPIQFLGNGHVPSIPSSVGTGSAFVPLTGDALRPRFTPSVGNQVLPSVVQGLPVIATGSVCFPGPSKLDPCLTPGNSMSERWALVRSKVPNATSLTWVGIWCFPGASTLGVDIRTVIAPDPNDVTNALAGSGDGSIPPPISGNHQAFAYSLVYGMARAYGLQLIGPWPQPSWDWQNECPATNQPPPQPPQPPPPPPPICPPCDILPPPPPPPPPECCPPAQITVQPCDPTTDVTLYGSEQAWLAKGDEVEFETELKKLLGNGWQTVQSDVSITGLMASRPTAGLSSQGMVSVNTLSAIGNSPS